ncbi:hypothetical protein Bbelb_292970 [Branchiostoma belcheri]|nr:hypothetical protein Bbelb_292970 [Branchiostoma belcheri]
MCRPKGLGVAVTTCLRNQALREPPRRGGVDNNANPSREEWNTFSHQTRRTTSHHRDNRLHRRDNKMCRRDSKMHRRENKMRHRDNKMRRRDSKMHRRDNRMHRRA